MTQAPALVLVLALALALVRVKAWQQHPRIPCRQSTTGALLS